MKVVASLSQGRTAAAQCGLFTHKSVPVIFEPPCTYEEGKMKPNAEEIKIYIVKLNNKIKNYDRKARTK